MMICYISFSAMFYTVLFQKLKEDYDIHHSYKDNNGMFDNVTIIVSLYH